MQCNAVIAVNGAQIAGTQRILQINSTWKGWLFSLDAIHPSRTSHAVIANEIIKVIQQAFKEGDIPDRKFGGIHRKAWKEYQDFEFDNIILGDTRNKNRVGGN